MANVVIIQLGLRIIRKQQVNMIGSYHNRILKEDGSNKRLLRTCLLVFAVLALFCLTSPASSLPLEGAFGNDDNRFRCKYNISSYCKLYLKFYTFKMFFFRFN